MTVQCYRSEFSCGVQLIRGETFYQDVTTLVRDLGRCIQNDAQYKDIEQYVYSHNTDRYDIGYKLEQYIVQNNLGTVIRSPRAPNPVHNAEAPNHHITVWVWTRNVKAFNEHIAALSKAQTDKAKADLEKKKSQQEAAKVQHLAEQLAPVEVVVPHFVPQKPLIFGKDY